MLRSLTTDLVSGRKSYILEALFFVFLQKFQFRKSFTQKTWKNKPEITSEDSAVLFSRLGIWPTLVSKN